MDRYDDNQEFLMANNLKMRLLSEIKSVMKKEEISQAEVARRIGAKRYNINKVMQKKLPVTLDFLLKMAEGLGLDVQMKVKRRKA